MKFRKDTLGSHAIGFVAVAIILAKMANPFLAQYGVVVPRAVGLLALGLIPVQNALMVEYELPDLPRKAPKIFNLFNAFLAVALVLIFGIFSAYMEVFPVRLTPLQTLVVCAFLFAGTSICINLAILSYKRLLKKYGLYPPT